MALINPELLCCFKFLKGLLLLQLATSHRYCQVFFCNCRKKCYSSDGAFKDKLKLGVSILLLRQRKSKKTATRCPIFLSGCETFDKVLQEYYLLIYF